MPDLEATYLITRASTTDQTERRLASSPYGLQPIPIFPHFPVFPLPS